MPPWSRREKWVVYVCPHRIRKHEESGEKLDPARNEPGKLLVK
jgi:hypothetical protein